MGLDLAPGAKANLCEAYLVDAILEDATLEGANLTLCLALKAHFHRASLVGAEMSGGMFIGAVFEEACLQGAVLRGAQMTGADLSGADLTGAAIHGLAAWDVTLEKVTTDDRTLSATQKDLVITHRRDDSDEQHVEVVDDLRIAQLIYQIRDNARISAVIQGVADKAVLVLGRFTPKARLEILQVIRDRLHDHGYLPVIFNFDRPEDRDWTETVRILAGLSRFVIVDLTDPKSVPLELEAIVPSFQIPFVPIFQSTDDEPFAMFQNLYNQFAWVLAPFKYSSKANINAHFKEAIVDRADAEVERLRARKGRRMVVLGPDDFSGDRPG